MLLAQALVAATRTTDGAPPHALHAQFVRAGRHGLPLEWTVERLRDGWQFALRRVTGTQEGLAIAIATVSFTRNARGLAHQDPMPDAPAPDGLPEWEDLRVRILGDPSAQIGRASG